MTERYSMSRVSREPGSPDMAGPAGIEPAAVPDVSALDVPAPDPSGVDASNPDVPTVPEAPALDVPTDPLTPPAVHPIARPLAAAAPEPLQTQATYRLLTMRGLAPNEAANLTAYLAGLQVHRSPWTLPQVNRLLFLRQLYENEAWREQERLGE